jgi:hypothetical protein
MATRMNMMKLLQEIRGLAQVTNPRPLPRAAAALSLQIRPPVPHHRALRRKHIIHISMEEPPDIPYPVKIKYLNFSEDSTFKSTAR